MYPDWRPLVWGDCSRLTKSGAFCVVSWGAYFTFSSWSLVGSRTKIRDAVSYSSSRDHVGPIVTRIIVWLSGLLLEIMV